MFLELADKVGRVIGPVLIHYLVINIISMMRLHADAAFLTSIAAVLVLPLFWQMYKKDKRADWEWPQDAGNGGFGLCENCGARYRLQFAADAGDELDPFFFLLFQPDAGGVV